MATRLRLRMALVPLLLPIVSLIPGGCASDRGLLYTRIVEPYTENYAHTPLGSKSCVVDIHRVREPFSGLDVTAEWNTDVIADSAREAGIATISHIDRETLSIFLGTYRRRRLIVYGD